MKKLGYSRIPLLLVSALAALAVPVVPQAAPTDIAQVPVLNISGTGSVKPNIMLLLDNSGSMDWAYMPDYVGGSGSNSNMCRTNATYASSPTVCKPGDPPFMAADFNGVYYNPDVSYAPPLYANGTAYASMTSAVTTGWTKVPTDGYNVQNNDMFGSTATTTNLVTGFPDRKWCDASNSSSCVTNTSYTYPDATYTDPVTIYKAAYYYKINTQEYCTDNSLSVCKSVVTGAAAPTGYAVPAKVRWCTTGAETTKLNTSGPLCQAIYKPTHVYPRFSVGLQGDVSYGTLAIGPTSTANRPLNGIASVTVNGSSIISGSVSPSSYDPNTAAGQQELATRVASKIIASTSTPYYLACVNAANVTPSPAVPACSTYGITLPSNNIVAILPVNCGSGKTACTRIYDGSRAGGAVAAVSLTPTVTSIKPTALINFAGGNTRNGGSPRLASVKYDGNTLKTSIGLGKNKSPSSVASTVAGAIGTVGISGGTVTAYVGGNSVTTLCQSQSNSTVCLVVNVTPMANNKAVTLGSISDPGALTVSAVNSAGGTTIVDVVSPLTGGTIIAGTGGSPDPFSRVDIVASQATYPRGTRRADCVAQAGVCTYAEEMTNFSNWYTYYHTRMQMMKTATGQAFTTLGGNYRVGFAQLTTLKGNGYNGNVDMLPAVFTGTDRSTWYSKLYAANPNSGTPLRESLAAIGKMYASTTNGVISYPCQQNYTIVTTDGYWNKASYTGGDGTVNNDNTENTARFCTKANGCYDGISSPAESPSLSDVALHWYNGGSSTSTISLRPDLEPSVASVGIVPTTASDPNSHLHMTTFTLGLGISGYMAYEKDYDKNPLVTGDFYKLITRASGCSWNSGSTYVWPDPKGDTQTAVDDLWHAGVNGHGKYFSARDPAAVVSGLSEALLSMSIRNGAASAAATSTPNVSQQDNDIYSATFTTGKWYGELFNQKIDPTNGNVLNNVNWLSTNTLGLQVAASADTRTIKMLDVGSGALKNFDYAAMSTLEKSWFNNKGSGMSQFGGLSGADQAIANTGDNLVKWMRGQQQYADGNIYRAYEPSPATQPGNYSGAWNAGIPIVLGDIDTAKPAYLRKPTKNYTTSGYSSFVAAQATRQPVVFAAANDGMLHAFDGSNGVELWAYAPRITMPKLYKQAAVDYGMNHQFTVDGSPEIGDVQIGGAWKTVLVAGLNAGGRGYYALDVTDPANPVGLWEFCADSTLCAKNDPDLGLSYGNPQFGYWGNKWVVMVTSGYNNIPGTDGINSGDGKGYLYVIDVANGTVLRKISTSTGSTGTPAGLAKLTAITSNPQTDPKITYVYGGDNEGNLFRFDFTDPGFSSIPVVKMAALGNGQPITTRPDVSLCSIGSAGLTRVVLVGTGRLLGVSDSTTVDTQSVYVVKDTGTALGNLNGHASMVKRTLSVMLSGKYGTTTEPVDFSQASVNGWYSDFTLNAGERVNLDPKIVFGTATVVTNRPTSASACSVGGTAYNYQFDLCASTTGSATQIQEIGGLLSNTSAVVGFIVIRLPSGTIKLISTLADGSKITSEVKVSSSSAPRKSGWRSVRN